MEAGNGTAGNGGEQHREDGLLDTGGVHAVADGDQARTGGIHHVGVRDHNADGGNGQHGVQQEGGQVVTGLEQNPDGGDGSNGDVQANNPHPGGVGQVDGMPVHADGHAQADGDDTGDGGNAHGGIPAVNHEAEGNGDDDEKQGNHGHRSGGSGGGQIHLTVHILGGEGAGHDGSEGSYHQNQGQVGEDDEQTLCPQAHVGGDDLADGLALMADGGEQGAEVMDAAEEDAAHQNPQHTGQPAEHGGGDGAGNGAGTGDGGEVVSHQHRGLGGNVVDAILHGVRGGGLVGFTDAPLLAQVAAVEDVAAQENGDSDQKKYETVHWIDNSLSFTFSGDGNSAPDSFWLPHPLDWSRSFS